jgi:hypothetical protein
MSKVIFLERCILNVTDPADRWVAGYAAIITTPEETYALQVRKVDLTKLPYVSEDSIGYVMCALWAHTATGMESVATWWCNAHEVGKHVGELLQCNVEVTWRQ